MEESVKLFLEFKNEKNEEIENILKLNKLEIISTDEESLQFIVMYQRNISTKDHGDRKRTSRQAASEFRLKSINITIKVNVSV